MVTTPGPFWGLLMRYRPAARGFPVRPLPGISGPQSSGAQLLRPVPIRQGGYHGYPASPAGQVGDGAVHRGGVHDVGETPACLRDAHLLLCHGASVHWRAEG